MSNVSSGFSIETLINFTSASAFSGISSSWQKFTTVKSGALNTIALMVENQLGTDCPGTKIDIFTEDKSPGNASAGNKFLGLTPLVSSNTLMIPKSTNQTERVFSFPATPLLSANTVYYLAFNDNSCAGLRTTLTADFSDGGAGGSFRRLYLSLIHI